MAAPPTEPQLSRKRPREESVSDDDSPISTDSAPPRDHPIHVEPTSNTGSANSSQPPPPPDPLAGLITPQLLGVPIPNIEWDTKTESKEQLQAKYDQYSKWLEDYGMDLSDVIRLLMEASRRKLKEYVIEGHLHIPKSRVNSNLFNAVLDGTTSLHWSPFASRLARNTRKVCAQFVFVFNSSMPNTLIILLFSLQNVSMAPLTVPNTFVVPSRNSPVSPTFL